MNRILAPDWENMAVVAKYDARELAKLTRLSVRQLQRDFRRRFARTPQDWLNEKRLKEAETLLLSGQSVKAVAIGLGFKQVSHFCRQFKSYRNVTPTRFVISGQVLGMSPTDNNCR